MIRTQALLLAVVAWALVLAGTLAAEEKQVLKFCRFQSGDLVSYGVVEGDLVRRIQGTPFGHWQTTNELYELNAVKLLVPCTPSKVLATAGNYKSHLGDTKPHPYPELFFKVPSCLIAHGENVVIPPGTEDVHFEAEVVIVIGRRAKNVPVEKALDYVLGITCGNDISARDWQKNDVQWWRAKGSDTFGPVGPFIVSGIDYYNLQLTMRVNGKVKQQENTKNMVHNLAQIVSFASRYVTLEPGDLIFTGTPGTTTPIKEGDVLEVELEGVGVLRNGVVKAAK